MCLIPGHSVLLSVSCSCDLCLKTVSSYVPTPSSNFSISPSFPWQSGLPSYCSSGLVNQQKPTLPQVLQAQFDLKCDFGHVGHNMPLPSPQVAARIQNQGLPSPQCLLDYTVLDY